MAATAWCWAVLCQIGKKGVKPGCCVLPTLLFGKGSILLLLLWRLKSWILSLQGLSSGLGAPEPKLLPTDTLHKARPHKGVTESSSGTSEAFQQSLALLGDVASLSFLGSFPSHPKNNMITEYMWLPWEQELAALPDFVANSRRILVNSRPRCLWL